MRRLIVALLVLLAGCGAAPAPTPTDTGTPYDTTTPQPTLKPGENVTVIFDLVATIDGWEFPATLIFERPNENFTRWTTVWEYVVYENEQFNVTLTVGQRYRITAVDAEGDRRMLGGFIPRERDRSYTIRISCLCP